MKNIYQDILNRSYNALFHPSVQWPKLLKKGYQVPRYPAPASEQAHHNDHDFKTPYRDSKYHVRHNDYEIDRSAQRFVADPLLESIPEKQSIYILYSWLVRYRLLKRNQMNDTEAVEGAKLLYQQKYGDPVEEKIYENEDVDDVLPEIMKGQASRELMASFIRQEFEEINEISALDLNQCQLEIDDKPILNEKVGHNINENDPVFRQLIVDIHTLLARFGERNAKEGHLKRFVGDPNYWHTLDNSFKPEQIRQIQSAIGDEVSTLDSKQLAQKQNSEEYHRQGKIQYPIENKYYQ